MAKLSESFRTSLRFFSFYLSSGTLEYELLGDVDYQGVLNEPSALEMIYAIFSNVIELDDDGQVRNQPQAMRRAAQYILTWIDSDYVVEPPFEDWEIELHLA
jgi:hypothetical protein